MLWPDIHFPYADMRAIKLLYRFIREAKPDIHVNMGDLLNCAAVSHHNKNNKRLRALNPIDVDFDCADKYWDTLRSLNPNSKLVWLEGNHCQWLRDYRDENPEVGDSLDIEKRLRLKERKIKFIPYKSQASKPFMLGKLALVHGWFTGKHHTQKTADMVDHNIVYGHVHDVQVSTKQSIVSSRHIAMSIGHLSDETSEAMSYLRTPTNWLKAFAMVQFDTKSGHFDIEVKMIPDYKFHWNGKLWRG